MQSRFGASYFITLKKKFKERSLEMVELLKPRVVPKFGQFTNGSPVWPVSRLAGISRGAVKMVYSRLKKMVNT
jgi:hypothetical protein